MGIDPLAAAAIRIARFQWSRFDAVVRWIPGDAASTTGGISGGRPRDSSFVPISIGDACISLGRAELLAGFRQHTLVQQPVDGSLGRRACWTSRRSTGRNSRVALWDPCTAVRLRVADIGLRRAQR